MGEDHPLPLPPAIQGYRCVARGAGRPAAVWAETDHLRRYLFQTTPNAGSRNDIRSADLAKAAHRLDFSGPVLVELPDLGPAEGTR